MSECFCRLSNPHLLCVQVQVQAEAAGDGGPEIRKKVHDFHLVIIDGDGGSRFCTLPLMFVLLRLIVNTVFADLEEAVQQGLDVCCEWVASAALRSEQVLY